MTEALLGENVPRVDGRLKVTGQARYSAEFPLPHLSYAVLVLSTAPGGRIKTLDTAAAEALPGVLAVITPRNVEKLAGASQGSSGGPQGGGESAMVMQSDEIHYNGQIIGCVVAETIEQARQAASLWKVTYEPGKAYVALEDQGYPVVHPKDRFGIPLQTGRGNPDPVLKDPSLVVVDETYETPLEVHNPMETHATTATWDGDRLLVYDSTQYVDGDRANIAKAFGLKPENVRVVTHFVGGGFGGKGSTWQHVIVAGLAARKVRRPVQLMLSRADMFTCVGNRSRTLQRIALAATKEGKLQAIRHDVTSQTSLLQVFIESSALMTRLLYACPNLGVSQAVARLNLPTSTFMRAPGEATGSVALECGMDELAYKLGMDPVALRLASYAETDPDSGLPWSGKNLKDCYHRGAETFGWAKRNPQPGSMRDGRRLVGWGMATGTYPGNRQPASARARLNADGTAVASSATVEIGQGNYTVMTQIAAAELGLALDKVHFDMGDSDYPMAPITAGSMTVASVGSAVATATRQLKETLIGLAVRQTHSPLHGLKPEQVVAKEGHLIAKDHPQRSLSYQAVLKAAKLPFVEVQVDKPIAVRGESEDCRKATGADGACYAFHSFAAYFTEVKVDPETWETRVTRVVGVYDVGRVLNPRTARSQAMGAVNMGLGQALLEEVVVDPATGRIMTKNLADYRVPVNADAPAVELLFVDKPDPHFNILGARGAGELPMVGVAASIANAVYHATGKRIRKLPITPESLL